MQVASTNVGDEHAATVWYALHPGGMLAISPGSRSAPGENERPAISDPGGVTAPKRLRPLRCRKVVRDLVPVVALRLPPANGYEPSGFGLIGSRTLRSDEPDFILFHNCPFLSVSVSTLNDRRTC
jgi:hypothetical protein